MTRPSLDEYFLQMAKLVSTRGTCHRRKVGSVLVNKKGHVLSTGYNGVPRGFAHCTDRQCSAALSESGTNLEGCQAVHAEQNALLQCKDVYDIYTCYTTVSPCIHCIKLLLNTSCERIVFLEEYPHSDSEKMWLSSMIGNSSRKWINFTKEKEDVSKR